jgi:hypothetical protein
LIFLFVFAKAIDGRIVTPHPALPPSPQRGEGIKSERAAMKSYELLREVFKKVGCKNVARELNRSETLVHKWSRGRDGRSEVKNPLDYIAELIRITGDKQLAQWVCAQAGGYFVANPKAKDGKPKDLVLAENETVEEFGDLMAVMGRTVKDGRITREESEVIRSRWEELKSVTEGFVRCCEDGNFSRMNHSHAAKNAPPMQQARV